MIKLSWNVGTKGFADMIQEIAAVLAAPKQATDIAKGISAINVDFEVKTKTSELLSAIIDLENSMLELQGRFGALQSLRCFKTSIPKAHL